MCLYECGCAYVCICYAHVSSLCIGFENTTYICSQCSSILCYSLTKSTLLLYTMYSMYSGTSLLRTLLLYTMYSMYSGTSLLRTLWDLKFSPYYRGFLNFQRFVIERSHGTCICAQCGYQCVADEEGKISGNYSTQ